MFSAPSGKCKISDSSRRKVISSPHCQKPHMKLSRACGEPSVPTVSEAAAVPDRAAEEGDEVGAVEDEGAAYDGGLLFFACARADFCAELSKAEKRASYSSSFIYIKWSRRWGKDGVSVRETDR